MANLTLSNPRNRDLAPLAVNALANSGALLLCIPAHVALELELDELEKREVTIADGTKHLCSYVGPIEVKFENRKCFAGALVLGEKVLLGAVPMEDMDILLSPTRQSVIVNPESPNFASAMVMRAV